MKEKAANMDNFAKWSAAWINLDDANGEEEWDLEEVAYQLCMIEPQGVALLKSYLHSSNTLKRRLALYFLAKCYFKADTKVEDAALLQALLDAFYSPDETIKISGIMGLLDLEYFTLPRSEVETLLAGDHLRLSAWATIYLSRAYRAEKITILTAALQSDNPRTREYACDEVGDYEVSELKGYLIHLLTDPDKNVRSAAASNLPFFD